MTASSAESLSRNSGSASNERSSATNRMATRRRTARFIVQTGLKTERPLSQPNHLAAHGTRCVGAEKCHGGRDLLALDVADVAAHRRFIRYSAYRAGCERIGAHTLVASLISDGTHESHDSRLGGGVRRRFSGARTFERGFRRKEHDRAASLLNHWEERARYQIRGGEVDAKHCFKGYRLSRGDRS